MGFRLQKCIRIFKGLTLNLSTRVRQFKPLLEGRLQLNQ